MHAVWSRPDQRALAGLGFEFLSTYVARRAVDLGDAAPGVFVSSFAAWLAAAVTVADLTTVVSFAGVAYQPWPHDPVGRVWRACELCASTAATATSQRAAARGWSPEQLTATAERLRPDSRLDGDVLSHRGQLARRPRVWMGRFPEAVPAAVDGARRRSEDP